MKNLFAVLVVAVSLLGGVTGAAQSLKVGLKGGVSLVNQKFSGDGIDYNPNSKVSPHFGIFARVKPTAQFGFQPEVLFAAQGYGKNTISFPEEGITFLYLTLPLMLQYYPVDMINIHAGPQLGYMIGGTKINGESVIEDAKKGEVALAVGAELYPVKKVGLGIRYVAGLTDVYDGINADLLTVRNKTVQFSLLISLN